MIFENVHEKNKTGIVRKKKTKVDNSMRSNRSNIIPALTTFVHKNIFDL